jgi:hypothetical protein
VRAIIYTAPLALLRPRASTPTANDRFQTLAEGWKTVKSIPPTGEIVGAALEAAQAAYEVAKRDVQRVDDKAEEVVQAQVRAAYM